jgi:ribose transport system ATP-binding protein
VLAGEVHALTGENGAGKSTLAKVIAGLIAPTSGGMQLEGQRDAPSSRHAAEKAGVRMVLQELNLVSTLSVAENLFIDALPHRMGLVNYRALEAAARPVMEQVGLAGVAPSQLVGLLGIGQQQMVEIAAHLIGQCRLLILDEPTAALTDREVNLLFERISALKRRGVGIVYISHRLDEVKRIADRVTVLRDGRVVGTRSTAEVEIDDVVHMMVGREIPERSTLTRHAIGAPILRVESLRRGNAVRDVSFTLHHGEILGFAGLIGSGRTETMRLIFGADRKDAGKIFLDDVRDPVTIRSPRDAVRRGIAMITEDRKTQGLLLPLAVKLNITLANIAGIAHRGWLNRDEESSVARRFGALLDLKAHSPDQPVESLSGGNQQKVVVVRWLYRDSRVLLFDEPTRGIDVGAKFDIYKLLGELAAQGKGIVIASSDLKELMQVCDRIAAMSGGKLVRIFTRAECSQEAILEAAFSESLEQKRAA